MKVTVSENIGMIVKSTGNQCEIFVKRFRCPPAKNRKCANEGKGKGKGRGKNCNGVTE